MFTSVSDAKTFLLNSGYIDNIDLSQEAEITEALYRNATDKESAEAIIESFLI